MSSTAPEQAHGQVGSATRPMRTWSFGRREAVETIVPITVALAGTWIAFRLTPLDGALGFVLVAMAVFLTSLYVSVSRTRGRKHGIDRVVGVTIAVAALTTAIPLIAIMWTVVDRGIAGLSVNFFTKTMSGVEPTAPSTTGGALHAVVGTMIQVGYATLVSVPFGVATAVYLTEIRGRFTPIVRLMVDAMSGIPSIVAGLFIYTVWVLGPGRGFSGFAAALGLAILMLPTVARASEEMLRLVDPGLRESSLALGSSQWRTVWQVALPTARAGIITAVILGIARVAGETAPLLMTSFGNEKVVGPASALKEPQSALPLFIYQMFAQDQRERAWTATLVLILIVLLLFVVARLIGRDRAKRR